MGLGTFRAAPLNSSSSSSPETLKENQATDRLLFLPWSQCPPTSRVMGLEVRLTHSIKISLPALHLLLQRQHPVQWPPLSTSPSAIYTNLALHGIPCLIPLCLHCMAFPPVSTLSVLTDYSLGQSPPDYIQHQPLHSLQSAQFLELINQTPVLVCLNPFTHSFSSYLHKIQAY